MPTDSLNAFPVVDAARVSDLRVTEKPTVLSATPFALPVLQ